MAKKVLLGILIILIVISGIFMRVNSASVKAKENTTAGAVEHAQDSLKSEESTSKETEENKANSQEAKKEEANTEENEEKEETKEEKAEEYISEDDLIYSNKYLVKEKAIYRIEPKTSIKEFKKNIEIAKGQEIKIYKEEKEITSGYIGTGMVVKGARGEEYELSVIGDITGEGIANQIELTMIIRHLINQKGWELEGIEKNSADITGDGEINLIDITKLINYIVYGKWEHEEIKTPKEPEIKVISKKEEGQDYYISEVKIKIEGAKEQKTTYKITGDKEQEEKEIKEDEIVTITGAGKYIITAYSYGKEGNKSKGINKIITIKELVPNLTKENTKISYTPTQWTKGPVEVKIETEVETEKEGYTLQYSKDGENWEDYSKEIEIEENGEIYARIRDEEKRAGGIIKEKIENIDKLEPEEVTIERVTQNTNSIEIEAKAKDKEATETDGKSEIAKYYFSIDGGKTWEPEEGQKEGTYKFEKLAQNKEYNVVVKAEDKAGNSKETEIKKVTTGEVPEGTGNIEIKKSEENWTNKNIKITIENKAGDEYRVEYSRDKETWEDYSKEIEVEENGKIYARLKDSIGNVGKEIEETIENIDKVAPAVKLEPNGGTNYTMPSKGSAKISTVLTAEDPKATETNGCSGLKTLEYAWSQSKEEEPTTWETFTNGSKVEKADINAPGTWYLWTKVEDEAGNRSEEIKVSNPFTITSNTEEANKITVEPNIEAEEWTNGDVTVKVDYGENLSGETKITVTGEKGKDYEIDNKGNIIVKTNGTTITVEAKDEAGNIITKTITIENIDKVKPTVNAEVPTNWTTGNKEITVSGNDGESGIAGYYVGTESPAPEVNATGWSMNTTYSKGEGTYYVWSKDNAGNISEVKQVEVTKITTSKPVIELSENSNEEWAKSRNVTVTLRDNESGLAEGAVVKYGWSTSNEAEPTSYTTATLNYTEGAKTATFTASIREGTGKYYLWVEPRALTNTAGASQTEITKSTGTFYIDNTLPTVNAEVPTNWTNEEKEITVSGNDGESGIAGYYVGTESTAPEINAEGWSMNTTYSKGVGIYYVWSKDNAGNISAVEEVEVTNIDTVKPTVNAEVPTNWTTGNKEITVSGSDGDSGIAGYYIGTESTAPEINAEGWSMNTTYSKGVGIYYVWSKDNAGNISEVEKVEVTNIDTVRPTVEVAVPTNWTTENKTITISGSDEESGVAGYYVGTENIEPEVDATVWSMNTTYSKGVGTYYVWSKDNAGNISEVEKVEVTNIDTVKPTITVVPASTVALAANNYATLANVTITVADNEGGSGLNSSNSYQYYLSTSDTALSGGEWLDYTSEAEFTIGADKTGTYYLFVKRISDEAGNISTENGTAVTINGTTYQRFGEYKFDNEAPTAGTLTMKIDSSIGSDYTNNTWTNQSVYIAKEDGSDAHSGHNITTYSVSLEEETKLEHQTEATTLTEDGTYTVTVTTTDKVGKTSSNTYTIKIDKTEPTIDRITATTTNWTNNDVTLSGKAADSQSGIVAYQFSQEINLTATSEGWTDITVTTEQISKNYTAKKTGTWYFYVKDAVGNINKKEIEVKIDKLPPTVELEPNGGEGYILPPNGNATISATITASDPEGDDKNGCSELQTILYAWSNRNTTEPKNWHSFHFNDFSRPTFTKDVSSSDINETGTWYLWTKVIDNAGNYAGGQPEEGQVLAAFEVIEPKIGDYVNYQPDGATSYNLSSDYSGSDKNQTIYRDNSMNWQILKIDSDGKIDLIGSPTADKVTFKGALGYNNGVYIMHDICKELYSNKSAGIEARSVSLEDFENDNNGGMWLEKRNDYIYSIGDVKYEQYGRTKTYENDNTNYPNLYDQEIGSGVGTSTVKIKGIKDTDKYYTTPTTETSSKADSKLTGTQTHYDLKITEDNYGESYKVLSVQNDSEGYWVASRCVILMNNYIWFDLRDVDLTCGIRSRNQYCSNGETAERTKKLRPVVTVNARDFQIIPKSGSGSDWATEPT